MLFVDRAVVALAMQVHLVNIRMKLSSLVRNKNYSYELFMFVGGSHSMFTSSAGSNVSQPNDRRSQQQQQQQLNCRTSSTMHVCWHRQTTLSKEDLHKVSFG